MPEVEGSNQGPVAVVGPDRKLTLPLRSLLLDGSGSTDDHGVTGYRWEAVRYAGALQTQTRRSPAVGLLSPCAVRSA